MSRAKGQRSADFEVRRRKLIESAREAMVRSDSGPPSLRDLAAACGVTVPTLVHYFGRRGDLVRAVMEQHAADARPYLVRIETTELPFRSSVVELAQFVLGGLNAGLSGTLSMGLSEARRRATLGPAFLGKVVDPIADAVVKRLELHVARGEMKPCELRHAALFLISPLILATLHQHELGGAGCNPLDLDALARSLADGFIAAYAAP